MFTRQRVLLVLLAVGLITLLLAACFAAFPVDQDQTPKAPTQTKIPKAKAPKVKNQLPSPSPAPEPRRTPPAHPKVLLNRLLAQEEGFMHVTCYVGEEYNGLRNVYDGWYSANVKPGDGEGAVRVDMFSVLLKLSWTAAPDATEARCVPKPATWAEIVATVVNDEGEPVKGAAVIGCGGVGETGVDGVVAFQVLANTKPCTLESFIWTGEQYLASFFRLGPIIEHDQHHVYIRLLNYGVNSSPAFDFDALGDAPLNANVDFDLLDVEERSSEERVQTAEEQIVGYRDHIATLNRIQAEDPRTAPAVALEIKRHEILISASESYIEKALDELEELEEVAEPAPP